MDITCATAISNIIKNGHEVGLHFDCSFYNISNEEELINKLHFEKDILEGVFGLQVSSFSFHNPTEDILKYNKDQYAGMFNTYGLGFKKLRYCSDSNGYWRHKSIKDALLEDDSLPIQILTHPEWWNDSVMSPKERVWKCIDDNTEKVKDWYNQELISYNRENIDW